LCPFINIATYALKHADLAEIAKFLGITTTVDTDAIQVSHLITAITLFYQISSYNYDKPKQLTTAYMFIEYFEFLYISFFYDAFAFLNCSDILCIHIPFLVYSFLYNQLKMHSYIFLVNCLSSW